MDAPQLRHGTTEDIATVLGLLDRAARWLVEQGREGQWGTESQAGNPRRIAQVTAFAESGGLWLAEVGDRVAGALSVGSAPPHIPAVDEPELYVQLLVTDRAFAGTGVGTALLEHARALARRQGAALLRVDCYAGGDGALVRYYERQGFDRAERFTVPVGDGQWPGCVLVQRLAR